MVRSFWRHLRSLLSIISIHLFYFNDRVYMVKIFLTKFEIIMFMIILRLHGKNLSCKVRNYNPYPPNHKNFNYKTLKAMKVRLRKSNQKDSSSIPL